MAENTLDNSYKWIIDAMPYGKDFLFVDDIHFVDENSIEASFTFREDLAFYEHHFVGNPITPGVILTECMAQIGLVAFGIYNYITRDTLSVKPRIGLSSTEMQFYKPVFPSDKVRVVSEKQYFRFGKLKCSCKMFNMKNELISKGEISGMIDNKNHA